jgi:SOS-response transcriptional repressor LexA
VTETQTRVFTFIKGYLAAYRIPPTLVEIAEACGLSSTGSVRYVLDALEDAGEDFPPAEDRPLDRGGGPMTHLLLYFRRDYRREDMTSCPQCGAVVHYNDQTLHDRWHARHNEPRP